MFLIIEINIVKMVNILFKEVLIFDQTLYRYIK